MREKDLNVWLLLFQKIFINLISMNLNKLFERNIKVKKKKNIVMAFSKKTWKIFCYIIAYRNSINKRLIFLLI